MSVRKVYMNGKFVDESESRISIYDSALMFGDMLFEMTRSFNQKQFKLREHLERLYRGLKILRIPLEMTIEELEDACYQTLEANKELFPPNEEHRLMINVSRGPLSIYSRVLGMQMKPTVVIADFPLKWTIVGMGELFDVGINAVTPSQRAIPPVYLDPKIKSRSRLHYQIANIEVAQLKGSNNWALLLDHNGFVTEGTGTNFFIVKSGCLYTPKSNNVLRGVSRDYVFGLCKQLGISCEERDLEPYDVHHADEAFMTGTPFCMLPVVSLNSIKIGEAKMGPVFKKLMDQWSKNVGVDIIQQIKDYNQEITDLSTPDAPSPYQFQTSKDGAADE